MPKYTQQQDLIDALKKLEGYEGYVQFSHKELEIIKPIEIKTPNESNVFLVEAYYCNKTEKKSIAVRYYAGAWYWEDDIDLSKAEGNDIQTYQTKYDENAILSQVWIAEDDEYCNNWKVKKLKKVVFSGFIDTAGGKS
jgi:CRISPR type III-associated protein (TIGR04423 family)